jgi:hypothetical protein
MEPIIQSLLMTVPPGKAMRTYENNAAAAKNKGVRTLTDEEKQMSGARTIINARFKAQESSGRIVVDKRDGERWVKFSERRVAGVKPGEPCPTCGHPFGPAPAIPSNLPENVIAFPRPAKTRPTGSDSLR